jgi:hypothetical protein
MREVWPSLGCRPAYIRLGPASLAAAEKLVRCRLCDLIPVVLDRRGPDVGDLGLIGRTRSTVHLALPGPQSVVPPLLVARQPSARLPES